MSKFFHSIRWRLQLWHGLLLVFVLTGFGFTAFQFQKANTLRRIDGELQQRLRIVGDVLRQRGPPPRPRPGLGPPERGETPGERPPRPLEDGRPPPRDFQLPPREQYLFDADGTNSFYYIVWRRDGELLSSSATAPASIGRPRGDGEYQSMRMRGSVRELFHITRPGECMLVGRDTRVDLADLRRLAVLLVAAGAGVLALGLAGGWWLAGRAIRPVQDISATALRISTGDLSRRIHTADTDSELGELTTVLNSTFARLQAAFEQQARFTADAAHELRTPVTVLLSQTQTTLSRQRMPEDYRAALEACQRAAQRMRRLIESLLELARLDAGQENLRRERIDVSGIVRDTVELLKPLAAEREVTIDCELSTAYCLCDSGHIAQVVNNVLTNAIHHNCKGGEARVSTAVENGMMLMTIRDTGEGIAPEHLPHIFERFYRGDAARSHRNGRTGLGLAISKAIVDAHGGTIDVDSELGKGTTVQVRLPAAV